MERGRVQETEENNDRYVVKTKANINNNMNQVATPFNFFSKPIRNALAVRDKISRNWTILGYIQKLITGLNDGETLIISQNTQGEVKATIKLVGDGNMELNGNADNAVRYSKLEEAYNQLKSDHDNLVAQFNAHMHPTAATGPPSTPTPVPGNIPVEPSTGNIEPSKIDEIKVP